MHLGFSGVVLSYSTGVSPEIANDRLLYGPLPLPDRATPIPSYSYSPPDSFGAWLALISVAVCVIVVICFCYLCWRYYPSTHFAPSQALSRRQSSQAELVPVSTAIATFHTRDPGSTPGEGGVVNFAFEGRFQVPLGRTLDRPPSYTTVMNQDAPPTEPPPHLPRGCAANKVAETPPPAYLTVAPFRSEDPSSG